MALIVTDPFIGLTLLVESQRVQDIDEPRVVGTVRHTRGGPLCHAATPSLVKGRLDVYKVNRVLRVVRKPSYPFS